MLTKEQALKLKRGDCVRLRKWINKKDGTKNLTTNENAIVAGANEVWISFKNLTSYFKDAEYKDYGITWDLDSPINSYVKENEYGN